MSSAVNGTPGCTKAAALSGQNDKIAIRIAVSKPAVICRTRDLAEKDGQSWSLSRRAVAPIWVIMVGAVLFGGHAREAVGRDPCMCYAATTVARRNRLATLFSFS